ncbi:Kinesin-like protein kip2 [Microbotryomycetes sp. JL201]|nr:Kinesin-like protein kip2 [Microbotryomycetes sp. JL201]
MASAPHWQGGGAATSMPSPRPGPVVTQHGPSTLDTAPYGLPTPGRSLFVPIRKHGSSSTCGSTPSLSPPTSPRESTAVRTNLLTPSTQHNVMSQYTYQKQPVASPMAPPPKFNLLSPTSNSSGATVLLQPRVLGAKKSTPSLRPLASNTQIDTTHAGASGPSTFMCNSSPLSTAPKIRAKVTAVATPRKKPALVGTDNVVSCTPRSGLGNVTGVAAKKQVAGHLSSSHAVTSPSYSQYGSFDTNHPELNMHPNVVTATPSRRAANGDMGRLVTEQAAFTSMTGSARMYRSAKGKDNVLVCVRVRPPAAKLVSSDTVNDEQAWTTDEATGRVQLKTGNQEFLFDSVVTGSDNACVYEEAGKDLVLAAMEGFDSVIFAYGQTASGKTFTLTGNAANPGIIPQSVAEIFAYIREHPEQEFLLRASYLEIYNETLKDLLAPETGALRIRQDEKKRFFVSPLREEVVTHEAQVAALLRRGEASRSVGATDFNETSSRSHSLFQMTIESRARDDFIVSAAGELRGAPGTPRSATSCGGSVRMSRLSLIDLAGSEQATSQAERRSEGAFINKSLLTLEKVIASLTEDTKRKPHVPYRDSKLTQILQPSLSGDARVAVIATINPSPSAVEESKSTLKFATRVKKVQLKAVVNEVIDDKALITKYRAEIVRLQVALQAAQSGSAPGTPTTTAIQGTEATSQMQEMQNQLSDLRSLIVTSRDVGDRRRSMQPSRPVSPLKAGRRSQAARPETVSEEDEGDAASSGATLVERLDEANDEIDYLKSENADLKRRISELEQEKLQHLSDFASESSKDAKIAQLVKENQEMLVVIKNQDNDAEMKRMEMRFKREIEKRIETERRLRDELEFERNRIKKMEKFIIDRIQTSYDLIMGKLPLQQHADMALDCSPPSESTPTQLQPGLPSSTSTISFGGLVGGAHLFCPIIAERSPDVSSSSTFAPIQRGHGRRSSTFDQEFDVAHEPKGHAAGPMYDDSDDDNIAEDAEFGRYEFLSKETRNTLKKSGSVMLLSNRSR